jgi:hypothetical protein
VACRAMAGIQEGEKNLVLAEISCDTNEQTNKQTPGTLAALETQVPKVMKKEAFHASAFAKTRSEART